MTPPITILTPAEIAQRRAELLAETGLDYDTLCERGAEYRLSPEQAVILQELEDLDFLAGV